MAGSDGRPDGEGGAADADQDFARRLDRLSRDLDAERREQAAAAARSSGGGAAGFGPAVRVASEFVAGVLVGAALGWGIDYLAGTSPWGLIAFLLLGFAAGVTNVVRVAGKPAGQANGTGRNGTEPGGTPRL